jgi:hypothetical protein
MPVGTVSRAPAARAPRGKASTPSGAGVAAPTPLKIDHPLLPELKDDPPWMLAT